MVRALSRTFVSRVKRNHPKTGYKKPKRAYKYIRKERRISKKTGKPYIKYVYAKKSNPLTKRKKRYEKRVYKRNVKGKSGKVKYRTYKLVKGTGKRKLGSKKGAFSS